VSVIHTHSRHVGTRLIHFLTAERVSYVLEPEQEKKVDFLSSEVYEPAFLFFVFEDLAHHAMVMNL
jgi:hypothetical protein